MENIYLSKLIKIIAKMSHKMTDLGVLFRGLYCENFHFPSKFFLYYIAKIVPYMYLVGEKGVNFFMILGYAISHIHFRRFLQFRIGL